MSCAQAVNKRDFDACLQSCTLAEINTCSFVFVCKDYHYVENEKRYNFSPLQDGLFKFISVSMDIVLV